VRKSEENIQGRPITFYPPKSITPAGLPWRDPIAPSSTAKSAIKEEDEDPKLQQIWLMQAFEFQVMAKTRDIRPAQPSQFRRHHLAEYASSRQVCRVAAKYLQKKTRELRGQ